MMPGGDESLTIERPLREPTQELIEAARAGEEEAWGKIDARYRPILALVMRGRVPAALRRRFDTQDVVQSALFTAFRELDSYEYQGKGSFQRWLVRILVNRLRQRNRHQLAAMRDAHREADLADHQEGVPSEADSPPDLAARAERFATLLTALADLPEEERRIVTRHVLDDIPLAQVAREMNTSQSAMRRKIEKALRRMQRMVAE